MNIYPDNVLIPDSDQYICIKNSNEYTIWSPSPRSLFCTTDLESKAKEIIDSLNSKLLIERGHQVADNLGFTPPLTKECLDKNVGWEFNHPNSGWQPSNRCESLAVYTVYGWKIKYQGKSFTYDQNILNLLKILRDEEGFQPFRKAVILNNNNPIVVNLMGLPFYENKYFKITGTIGNGELQDLYIEGLITVELLFKELEEQSKFLNLLTDQEELKDYLKYIIQELKSNFLSEEKIEEEFQKIKKEKATSPLKKKEKTIDKS